MFAHLLLGGMDVDVDVFRVDLKTESRKANLPSALKQELREMNVRGGPEVNPRERSLGQESSVQRIDGLLDLGRVDGSI